MSRKRKTIFKSVKLHFVSHPGRAEGLVYIYIYMYVRERVLIMERVECREKGNLVQLISRRNIYFFVAEIILIFILCLLFGVSSSGHLSNQFAQSWKNGYKYPR